MDVASLRFAQAVRRIGAAARACSWSVPAFRCPPRVPGVTRTIRRAPHGVVVAVAVADRVWDAVLADLVEGVVAANRLHGAAAARCRADLWAGLAGDPQALGDDADAAVAAA